MAPEPRRHFVWRSALGNRSHGASAGAGAAINAGAGVDDVLRVALRDGAHGAAVHAGAAADASVTDNIGHDMYTSIKMVLPILSHIFKIAMFIFGDREKIRDWLNFEKTGHDGKNTQT